MNYKLLYFCLPLFLSGCIGSFLTGRNEYLEQYPDIRTVPPREKAIEPRGHHKGEEKGARNVDLKKLEQDWQKITARDKALRERVFSEEPAL